MTHLETRLWEVESAEFYEDADLDPITTYLADLLARVHKAEEAYCATLLDADYMEAWRLRSLYERELLECLGVDCPECDGTEEVVVGWTRATMFTPSEPVLGRCPRCKGKGAVLPEEEA